MLGVRSTGSARTRIWAARAKEGVLVAWGYSTEGKRALVAVRLGQRESHEDWLDLGRDLTHRGLRSPWLVVSDGAPGLIKVIEELWPEADRGRCGVHKLRNVVAKLPGRPLIGRTRSDASQLRGKQLVECVVLVEGTRLIPRSRIQACRAGTLRGAASRHGLFARTNSCSSSS
jgi:putative transposase